MRKKNKAAEGRKLRSINIFKKRKYVVTAAAINLLN